MKCQEVRDFFAGISSRTPPQVPGADLKFFSDKGYILLTPKEEYVMGLAELEQLAQLNQQLQEEKSAVYGTAESLKEEDAKTHSFRFHFEGKEEKASEEQKVASDEQALDREKEEVAETESKVNELITKKSALDRLVPYGDLYISLTGLGLDTLKDLEVKNYRFADAEFADFMQESSAITADFEGVASRGSYYVSQLQAVPGINVREHEDTPYDSENRESSGDDDSEEQ